MNIQLIVGIAIIYAIVSQPFHNIARELKRMNDNAEKWRKESIYGKD